MNMSAQKQMLRLDHAVIAGASCLVGGFLLGLLTYHLIAGTPVQTAAPRMASMPSGPSSPMVAPPSATLPNYSEEIRELKKVLEREPKNRDLWVKLGNIYFDSAQRMEAVDAYTRALDLKPNDANVMTDRGIMYKDMGDYPSAIADFKKAAEIDPTHAQSLYNLGLTQLHDLKDYKAALEAWERLLKRNMPPEMASQMPQRVEALRKMIQEGNTGEAAGR
jgi:cytochrome c-type biogenesis protein CcmH/NrfG